MEEGEHEESVQEMEGQVGRGVRADVERGAAIVEREREHREGVVVEHHVGRRIEDLTQGLPGEAPYERLRGDVAGVVPVRELLAAAQRWGEADRRQREHDGDETGAERGLSHVTAG